MTDVGGTILENRPEEKRLSVLKRSASRYSLAMKNWLNGLPPDGEFEFDPEKATLPDHAQVSARNRNRKNRWRRVLFRRKVSVPQEDLEDEKTSLSIQIPLPDNVTRSGTNNVKTAKYTLVNFLPKNLYSQFHRVANFYFLFLIVLQAIPAVSNWNAGVAAIPLIVICGVTALKDAIEDWKRHQSDNKVNYAIAHCLKRAQSLQTPTGKPTSWQKFGKNLIRLSKWIKWKFLFIPTNPPESADDITGETRWKKRFWRDILVGDYVYLENDESIPADILILSTSEPEGVCFVETKNLDGETNLKLRHGLKQTRQVISAMDAEDILAELEISKPCSDLNAFQGAMKLQVKEGREELVPLTCDNLLLRGSILRNTSFAIGIVVYTGKDTKLALNTGHTPMKRSRIEKQMNPQIILSFGLLFIVCLICAIVQGKLVSDVIVKAPYWITPEFGSKMYSSGWFTGFLTFWSALILFQTLIPLSLYITVELIKSIQAYLIHNDLELYWEEGNQKCTPRAWNLSDDLGQIEYVFSDKTGTLTMNVMKFKACTINGNQYGKAAWNDTEVKEMHDALQKLLPHDYVSGKETTFVDVGLIRTFESNTEEVQFFRMVALTHSVLIDQSQDKRMLIELPHLIQYKAQSPDESALVESARDLGFAFLGCEEGVARVSVLGKVEEWQMLESVEFTSGRKRMSVILRSPTDNEIYLFCKGADNVIIERLAKKDEMAKVTLKHLEAFALEGLRTLCYSSRKLDREEWGKWHEEYNAAKGLVGDQREARMDELEDLIERDLTLLGATAIEDKLQDGVPECIEQLRQAGIKIWLLTGDKLETAINIGYSCSLLSRHMKLFVLKSGEMDKQLEAALEDCSCAGSYGLVLDGAALKEALQKDLRKVFLQVACGCEAVICCRTSPLQKAKVIELVRKSRNAMTLAIGDGANDVSMIQMADIGVGISTGREGMQAAMASDYAIGQFRFLKELLLVHGRWSYQRIAEATLQSFHKNVAFVAVSFWFQFYCAFTSQYVYDYAYAMFFNILLAILPILAVGCFDRDLERKSALMVPEAYVSGIRQQSYSFKIYGLYIANAVWQAAACFFIPRLAYMDNAIDSSGHPESMMLLGNAAGLSVILAVNLFVLENTYAWTWPVIAAQVGSVVALIGVLLVGSFTPGTSLYGGWAVFSIPRSYLCVVLSLAVALLPQVILRYTRSQLFPSELDILRELQKLGRMQEASARKKTTELPLYGDDGADTADADKEFRMETEERRPKGIRRFLRRRPYRGYAFSIEEKQRKNK